MRETWAGLVVGIACLFVAACGSPPPPRASTEIDISQPSETATGRPTAIPPVGSSSPAQPESPPSASAAAPTLRPTAPAPTLSPGEETLTFYVREDVARVCQPRRTDLPPGATAGIECSVESDLVERVGVYAFEGWADQVAAYRGRMDAAGIEPRSGDCRRGVPGDDNYWGVDEEAYVPYSPESQEYGIVVDGLPYLQNRIGCFLDQFGNANVRVTCDYGTYIGVLGRTNNLRDLTAWVYHPALDGEPGICVGADRDVY